MIQKMLILTIGCLFSLNIFAAQKIYSTIDPQVKLVGNKLEVEATVKLSVFKKSKIKQNVNRIQFVSNSMGCVDTYLCSATNFVIEDNKLLADIYLDLDMDGNIESVKKKIFLAYTNGNIIDQSKMTIVYVDTNKTIFEDGDNLLFYSITLRL